MTKDYILKNKYRGSSFQPMDPYERIMTALTKQKIETVIRQKILFIDDDRVTQELMMATLDSDFEVIGETSGAKAIESAEAVRPQIILLDLSMPNVDGFEVLKVLKAHPVLSSIPIICVSGKTDESSRARAYGLGASGFMSKPIDIMKMSTDIKSIMKSMNVVLNSIDGKRRMFIGFNSSETSTKLKLDLVATIESGTKAIVISLQEGSVFFDSPELQNELQKEHIFFFQAKPNLITKLPYLENLGPLMVDIKDLLGVELKFLALFVDSPETILNIKSQDHLTATTILLSESLKTSFQSVKYYSTSSQDREITKSLNAISKILIGSL